jgi:DNA-binding CsgD family transcriptional regulator
MTTSDTHPTPARSPWPTRAYPSRFPLWSLVTIAVLLGLDAIADLTTFGGPLHIAAEVGVALTSGGAIIVLWRRYAREKAEAARRARALESRVRDAEADLETSRLEIDRWRAEARRATAGLAAAVERTFATWKLSPSEVEIGFMLLKGFSHKEIADLRGTSERTVREQAGAIYRKAGIGGRAELSAWFLEDLLPGPHDEGGSPRT